VTVPINILTQIEAALLARDGNRRGDEITARCPFHDDQTPSFSFNVKKSAFKCQACSESGGWKKLALKLGITLAQRKPGRPPKAKAEPRIIATYDYQNTHGTLLFQTVRFDPKDFRQRRPDGAGNWIWNLDGVRRVLYRTPDLVDPTILDAVVYVVEGEKDVETLRSHGLVATCNPLGAGTGKWLPEYTEQLRGRHVVIIPDADEIGRKHADAVSASLFSVAASVAVLELPDSLQHGDVTDWLADNHTVEQLVALANAAEPLRRTSLADLRAVFRRHLVGNGDLIVAVLGAVAANRLAFDPVWLFVVGPPSSGKTERLMAAIGLPDVHLLSDLTVGGLLSGVPVRERVDGAKGGILREIGAYGQIIIKDFGTILSMANDPRNALLAAFRECYDGSFSRTVGSDGGKKVSWDGKLAVVAGVTEAIDQYHAVTGQLGERFLYFRCAPANRQEQARRSFENSGRTSTMRKELRDVVTRFFSTLDLTTWAIGWDEDDGSRIANLADLGSWLRSATFRSGRNYEMELVPGAEEPARLVQQLAALFQGMLAIGTSRSEAWQILTKVTLDCLPKLRRLALEALIAGDWMRTAAVAVAVNVPTSTMRRTLEDLAAHGIVERDAAHARSADADGDKHNDQWRLAPKARALFEATNVPTKPGTGSRKLNPEGAEDAFNKYQHVKEEFVGAFHRDADRDDEQQELDA
jgi:hypothetical protein